jgi:hypothetical protein
VLKIQALSSSASSSLSSWAVARGRVSGSVKRKMVSRMVNNLGIAAFIINGMNYRLNKGFSALVMDDFNIFGGSYDGWVFIK